VTAERYTAVFTGFFTGKESGEYLYVTMSEDPQCSGTLSRGRPPYELLGREIPFGDLPEGCRRLILDTYEKLWNL